MSWRRRGEVRSGRGRCEGELPDLARAQGERQAFGDGSADVAATRCYTPHHGEARRVGEPVGGVIGFRWIQAKTRPRLSITKRGGITYEEESRSVRGTAARAFTRKLWRSRGEGRAPAVRVPRRRRLPQRVSSSAERRRGVDRERTSEGRHDRGHRDRNAQGQRQEGRGHGLVRA